VGRLFVVSNRVAHPGDIQTGGLATALQSVLRQQRGVWVGWSGAFGESAPHVHIGDGIRYLTLDLPRDEFEAYYQGFANRTLWPLLHYRGDLVHYDRESYEGYLKVNARFADLLAGEVRGADVVWVHDYHLIPLAGELRRRGVAQRLGFFLHIPMPSWDVLCMLPGHRELLTQLAAYDVVGVQTEVDVENLRRYFDAVGMPAPACTVEAFPIGVDVDAVVRTASATTATRAAAELRTSLSGRRLAIGVDRLDYSKGLPERFRAFERHLDRAAGSRDGLTYLQIAPPTREVVPEYQALRHELERLAGHINGAHARPDWTPLRYVNHSYPHGVLTGFYRAADMALVTPLRDGMNLVAKEYVAAQDPHDPGVLILSRFAGAAQELTDALLVNPHDVEETAEAIQSAYAMPRPERRERWAAMMDTLRRNDIGAWTARFLQRLQGAPAPADALARTPALLQARARGAGADAAPRLSGGRPS